MIKPSRSRRSRGAKRPGEPRDHTSSYTLFVQVALLLAALAAAVLDDTGLSNLPLILATTAVGVSMYHVVAARLAARRKASKPAPTFALDTKEAVRAAASVTEVYLTLLRSIADSFRVSPVCLLIREDAGGAFRCAATSDTERSEALLATELAVDSFTVRRLARLTIPLHLESGEIETWVASLAFASSQAQEQRRVECAALRRMCSGLLLQITTRDELIGILSLPERPAEPFTAEEHRALHNIAAQLGLLVENAKLVERVVRHRQVEHELALAAEVQRNLLPAPPVVRGVEIAAFCQPAREVGGDYYDLIVLDDGTLAVTIADVAGKGMSAALLMSAVQASMRVQLLTQQVQRCAPAQAMTALNRLLCTSLAASSRFVTCFAAHLRPDLKGFTYINAGHNPPLLLRSSEQVALDSNVDRPASLSSGGPVLGVLEDINYEQGELGLGSGDILIAFTDGLTEALNSAGEEFGERRVAEVARSARALSSGAIAAALRGAVQQWAAGTPQHDDITVVVVKKNGSCPES